MTAAALALLIALHLAAPGTESIRPGDAAAHEGQRVRVQGLVVDSRSWGDGARSVVMQDGEALVVQHEGAPMDRGAWAEAVGELRRAGGELRLYGTLVATQPPAAAITPLAALAAAPDQFQGQALHVQGQVQGDRLRDGPHSVRLGDGPWQQGWVQARGTLIYDAACLCYRLHAQAVWSWT